MKTKQEPELLNLGEAMFANAKLGDQRRSKRLAVIFEQVRKHPGGTLPHKLKSPANLKALYRFCAAKGVTHDAIIDPLREYALGQVNPEADTVLILHDATELDFTSRRSLADQLGQIGTGGGRGYICHNSLAVAEDEGEVFGLTNQILHQRADVPEKETLPESRERESRESLLWLHGTKGLPAEWRFVDVCDQGADTFEFLEHEYLSKRRFVIRSKRRRCVYLGHEECGPRRPLAQQVEQLPQLGHSTVKVQAQPGRPARKAKVVVQAGPVLVPRPHARHGKYQGLTMPLWVVRVFEPKPPRGEKSLEWVLLTNHPVTTFAVAMRVIGWYESRWIIEELHKAMKTGCGIQNMQFTATSRLEPMIAVLSAVAVTLLNLRAASRREDAATRPATDVISVEYVQVLSGWRYHSVRSDLTIHEFFYALARLGGHQNRKRDKRPGWLVLWRGWMTLHAMLDGAEAVSRKKCG